MRAQRRSLFLLSLLLPLVGCSSPAPQARPETCRTLTPGDLPAQANGYQPHGFGFHLSPGQRFVVPEGDASWSVTITEPAVLEQASCAGASGLAFRAKGPGSTQVWAMGPPPRSGGLCQSCSPPGFIITAIVDNAAYPFDAVVPSSQFTWGDPIAIKVGTTLELVFPRPRNYFSWENLSVTDSAVLTRVDAKSAAGPGLALIRAVRPGDAYVTAQAPYDCGANTPPCIVPDWRFFRFDFHVIASRKSVDMTLTDADNGRRLELAVGQTLRIMLKTATGEAVPQLSLGHNTQVMLTSIGIPADDGQQSLVAAFQAVSTGEEEILKRCNAPCKKDFKLTVRIVPRADGVGAMITDASLGNSFQVPVGSRVIITLRPEIGPWSGVTSSDPTVLAADDTDTVDAPAGTVIKAFVARAPGETLLQAQSGCPSGRPCQYETLGDRVVVVPAA